MTTDLILAVTGLILVIGFLRSAKHLLAAAEKLRFAQKYLFKFRQYCKSAGDNDEAYEWLMQRAQVMQWQMGDGGIAEYYRPAFSNTLFRNHPVILNGLPEVRQAFAGGFSGRYIMDAVSSVEDFLVRHVGVVRHYQAQALRDFINPLIWFRDGVRAIINSPLWLLQWAGLLSGARATSISSNARFKLIQGIATVIAFISAVVSLIASFEPAMAIVRRVFKLP